mmetsp:Transcript_8236/g.24762  ORF Transcript_8236/g.24762 Transcript_8236/m.24762 type:complete len:256 (-) Transcript_8236:102-869(-)|eukprot:CAMPEP_0198727102 /NCGR_PEP_ID=MMETSP1475-20131203/3935_1 /TAXON_ID= ORGANISM="Unidentified sp., Strain CCMP1999" /NCGR_SAMPLE_ID=MMETSP1475 /ASSEMBLY_ACC=CAM_ASM_001111 /LENGTH=255 /DNA_ID=CAMNT_0044489095 /DNA_START=19 /DNA_END=786 /DNA_ORIENTATION=+
MRGAVAVGWKTQRWMNDKMTLLKELRPTGIVRHEGSWAAEILALVHNALRLAIHDMSSAVYALQKKGVEVNDAQIQYFFQYWTMFRLLFKAYMDIIQDYFTPLMQSRRSLPKNYVNGSDSVINVFDKLRDFCVLEKQCGKEDPSTLVPKIEKEFVIMANMVLEHISFQEVELSPLIEEAYEEQEGKIFVNSIFQRLNEDNFAEELLSMILRWMSKEERSKWMKKHLPLQSRLMYDLSWKNQFEKRYRAPLNNLTC